MSNRMQQPNVPVGFEYVEPYLQKFVLEYPHLDRNVFIMMPFTSVNTESIYRAVSNEVSAHGLVPLRADMRAFSPVLWWNIVTYMIGSAYGVVIYEPTAGISFNPNVSIEAGFMLALDRSVLLLANAELKQLPVDFAGHIFKTFEVSNISQSVSAGVKDWIERDLSYFSYGDKKIILFVSLGGTCRCVMAKGILSQRLHDMKITGVAVEAAAVADPHHSTVSPSAIKALAEIGCEHWLKGHRPRKLCQYLQDRADLIVALTDKDFVRTNSQRAKLVSDEQLFGKSIMNPYPDNEDEESLKRYRKSRKQIESAIDKHFVRILKHVGATPSI